MTMKTALTFDRVSKVYDAFGSGSRIALREASFEVPEGRKVAVVGRSESGKSTLLHLAAGIDVPTRGEVRVRGRNWGWKGQHYEKESNRCYWGRWFSRLRNHG